MNELWLNLNEVKFHLFGSECANEFKYIHCIRIAKSKFVHILIAKSFFWTKKHDTKTTDSTSSFLGLKFLLAFSLYMLLCIFFSIQFE